MIGIYTADHVRAFEKLMNAHDDELGTLIKQGLEDMSAMRQKCDEYRIVTYDYPDSGHFSLGDTLLGPRIFVPPSPDPEHLRQLRMFALQIAEGSGRDGSLMSGQDLTQLANYPDPLIVTLLDDSGGNIIFSGECQRTMVGTARIVQAMIGAQVTVARCEAPERLPDSYTARNRDKKCARWFVRGVGRGRPKRFCCPTCAKRAYRQA